MNEYCPTQLGVSYCLGISWWSHHCIVHFFVIVTILNMSIPWLELWRNCCQSIFINLSNAGWTRTWNTSNLTNTFTWFWIKPVMTMKKNNMYSSNFELLWRNWVPRILPIIPIHVDILMLHIFYVLNVIITAEKSVIFVLCINSMKQL